MVVVGKLDSVHQRPRCLECHKPLRPDTGSFDMQGELGDPIPEKNPDRNERVVKILRVTKITYRGPGWIRASYWTGAWGGYGDNCFCGLNCGYRWAVAHAKAR